MLDPRTMDRRTRVRAGFLVGFVALPAAAAAIACSTTLQGTLDIVTGPDDGFAESPKPTKLIVQLIGPDATTTIGEASLPTNAALTLPPQASDTVDILQITGFQADGAAVVSGTTIPVALDQLAGITLNIFVQRTGQFSRLPSADGGTGIFEGGTYANPLLTTLYGRYLLITDGNGHGTSTQLYDTLTWTVDPAPPPLATAPLSIAYVDTYTGSDAAPDGSESVAALLTLGKNGTANWLNITNSTSVDAEVFADALAPKPWAVQGGSFADIAGGQTIYDPDDGSSYIVGGTRSSGKPTAQVLRISNTGVPSAIAMNAPRLGAAAAYVPGQGLYVFGGNAATDAGASESGIEYIVGGTSKVFAISNVPADTTTGAGAVALDAYTILLAGGVTPKGEPAPVRLISVGNLGSGGDAGIVTSSLPVTLTHAQTFALTPTTPPNRWSAIVIGSEKSGASSAYLLTANGATPVDFRVTRMNAQGIILPNGSLAVVGGDSGTVESFIP